MHARVPINMNVRIEGIQLAARRQPCAGDTVCHPCVMYAHAARTEGTVEGRGTEKRSQLNINDVK